jgi:hypothetical protein
MRANTSDGWIMDFRDDNNNGAYSSFNANLQPAFEVALYFVDAGDTLFVNAFYAWKTWNTTTLLLDQWYHLCSTYDGSNLNNYLDGGFVKRSTNSGQEKEIDLSGVNINQPFFGSIPCLPESNCSTEPVNFYLDDVIFLNQILTATEVKRIYLYSI